MCENRMGDELCCVIVIIFVVITRIRTSAIDGPPVPGTARPPPALPVRSRPQHSPALLRFPSGLLLRLLWAQSPLHAKQQLWMMTMRLLQESADQ